MPLIRRDDIDDDSLQTDSECQMLPSVTHETRNEEIVALRIADALQPVIDALCEKGNDTALLVRRRNGY